MNKKPLAIMGGTFDPIHFGHLRTALELYQILDLESIQFLPCHQPVHKEKTRVLPLHRLAMLTLAIQDIPCFQVDDREIRAHDRPSYMIDTLISLRKSYPDQPLALILGSDAFMQVTSWKKWQHLTDYAHLIVPIRAAKKMPLEPELDRFLAQRQVLDYGALHDTLSGSIFLQSVTALDISSQAIRCQLEAGYDPHFLLPEAVLHYIKNNHLYE